LRDAGLAMGRRNGRRLASGGAGARSGITTAVMLGMGVLLVRPWRS